MATQKDLERLDDQIMGALARPEIKTVLAKITDEDLTRYAVGIRQQISAGASDLEVVNILRRFLDETAEKEG